MSIIVKNGQTLGILCQNLAWKVKKVKKLSKFWFKGQNSVLRSKIVLFVCKNFGFKVNNCQHFGSNVKICQNY